MKKEAVGCLSATPQTSQPQASKMFASQHFVKKHEEVHLLSPDVPSAKDAGLNHLDLSEHSSDVSENLPPWI